MVKTTNQYWKITKDDDFFNAFLVGKDWPWLWWGGLGSLRNFDDERKKVDVDVDVCGYMIYIWYILYIYDIYIILYLVGGLEHEFYFPIYWECHHPNWRTHIFQRGCNHQPYIYIYVALKSDLQTPWVLQLFFTTWFSPLVSVGCWLTKRWLLVNVLVIYFYVLTSNIYIYTHQIYTKYTSNMHQNTLWYTIIYCLYLFIYMYYIYSLYIVYYTFCWMHPFKHKTHWQWRALKITVEACLWLRIMIRSYFVSGWISLDSP